MSHYNQQVRNNLSRPLTPEISGETQRQLGLPLRPSIPASTKKISGVSPVIIQSKEGPQILTLVTNMNNNFQMLDTKLTKLEAAAKKSETSDDRFVRPSYLPFKTRDDILKYDHASTQECEEMKKYLLFYNPAVMRQMYPSMGFQEFKEAFIKGLNAAHSRVLARSKTSINVTKNENTLSEEELFNRAWSKENDENQAINTLDTSDRGENATGQEEDSSD